ncbi:NAD(P)H-binding protein [Actinomycetes bacterium KLBMP 9759]
MTILVAGATGTVGSEIVRQLAEAGEKVRALTRNPAAARVPKGVEVAFGDLTAPETLAPALDGVTAMHLITFGGDADLQTGPEIVELAGRAGVRRISVLSGFYEGGVEAALRAGDIGWTHLRPVGFMANALSWVASVREHGVVEVFGNQPGAIVHEADIAAVGVRALLEDGHAGAAYTITGPEAITPEEQVRILGAGIGRELGFVQLTEEQLRVQLEAEGADEEYIEFALLLGVAPPPEGAVVVPTVQDVTGRPARTFAQWVAEHADAFRP